MARVTYVKRAQQRYEMKPVLDENGKQVQVPVMKGDRQKTTKSGRPVFIGLTVRDYDKPKPMPKCGKCGITIEVGQPYKWIEPHGRGQLVRCATCPTWNVWEYSSSLSARIAEITDGDEVPDFDSTEDAQQWAADKAQQIRDLAAEKQEASDNMESGFGHETEQSNELRDIAEQLEQWADDVEGVDLPEFPEAEEEDCEECEGTGLFGEGTGEEKNCDVCEGSGRHTPDEPTEEQMDEWRDAVRSAIEDALSEVPV